MRIAIDARILRTSTGRYVERLLHYLQEIDHDNHYIVLLDALDFDSWQPSSPNFTKQRITVPNYSFREQLSYAWLLYRLKVDLVHFAMPQQPLLYLRPSITTIHDLTLITFKNYEDSNWLVYNIKQFIFRVVLYAAAHKSRHILTPTNYVQQEIAKRLRVPTSKITVTLEAADRVTKASEQAMPALANKPFIMYVGRMDPYKNIRRLIRAHQQLLQNHPDLQLALPGAKDGNVSVLEAWCKQQSFKQIHFLGFVSDEQLGWLFEHAGAYVFPSLSEGFGLPGLEAMSYGAPLVSSNATCLPEVYKDAAHYFDPTNVDDIAQKINEVLDNKALRDDLVQRGSHVVAEYSWRRMAEQTLEAYVQASRN